VYVVTAPSSEKPFSTPIPNINLQTKKPMFASTIVGVNDVRYTLMSSFAINNNFLDEDESNYTSSDGMYGRDTQPLRGQPFDQWYMIKYNNATYGTDVPYISYVTSNESYTELGTMAMPTSAGIISSGVTLYGGFINLAASVSVTFKSFLLRCTNLRELYLVCSNDNGSTWTTLYSSTFSAGQTDNTIGINIATPGSYKTYRWIFTRATGTFSLYTLYPLLSTLTDSLSINRSGGLTMNGMSNDFINNITYTNGSNFFQFQYGTRTVYIIGFTGLPSINLKKLIIYVYYSSTTYTVLNVTNVNLKDYNNVTLGLPEVLTMNRCAFYCFRDSDSVSNSGTSLAMSMYAPNIVIYGA
jgi:hypothetical protein